MIKIIPLAPFFLFFYHTVPLFLSLIHYHLISEAHLSQAHSLNSGLSSSLIHRRQPDSSLTLPPPKLDVTDPPTVPSCRSASNPCSHPPQTHTADRSACSWLCLLVDIGYLIGKPMELTNPSLLPTQLIDIVLVCDWWFCLVWVEEKDWRFEFFFFSSCCGLVVVVVVVAVADGRSGCGRCFGCFFWEVGYIILL